MIIMGVMLVGLLFFSNRSQNKREKEAKTMRSSLEVGDEIITRGGIIGRVVSLKDETVLMETGSDRTKIRIVRAAIESVSKV